MRNILFILLILLVGCSPVPINILTNPPTNDKPPTGFIISDRYEFEKPTDKPPTKDLDVCAVWGVNHVHRRAGGMYNPDGSVVPANDPRNYFESNPEQAKWVNGTIALVTDLNKHPESCGVVGSSIATIKNYDAPVFVSARMKVAPRGGTYWTALVSYSPNGWEPENDYQEFECEDSKAFTSSIHRKVDGGHRMTHTKKFTFPVDLSDKFHIYSALVLPNSMTIYLDNVAIWTINEVGLNVEPIYFMIENQIYSNCDTTLINDSNKAIMFPTSAYVDWIRIYKP